MNKEVIADFYQKFEPDIKSTTINWRIHTLVKIGVLNRIAKGKFVWNKTQNYNYEVSSKMKSIHTKLKKEFPYLTICFWDTIMLNEFMVHQVAKSYLLVEVEKEALLTVFYFLKENINLPVFVQPNQDVIDKYVPNDKQIIIIKPLISEAPLHTAKGINLASLEKILVDIFCDEVIFSAYQGSEMPTIFTEILNKYTLNQSRMLRYAARRGKRSRIKEYLLTVTNLEQ